LEDVVSGLGLRNKERKGMKGDGGGVQRGRESRGVAMSSPGRASLVASML